MRMPRAVLYSLCLFATITACAHEPLPASSSVASAETTTAHDTPELIQVRVLLVTYAGATGAAPEQQRAQAEALERATMLSNMARSGEPLAQLVPTYSDRADASVDFGVVKLDPRQQGALDASVVERALSLRVGGISDPIATPAGYVVVERMPDPAAGPERVGAKHILITYAGSPQPIAGATRTEADARALAEQIAAQAQATDADWDALAQRYTEEPGGKERAGDLGVFGRGQMVPAFESAAFKLAVGKVSGVVQSPFGFHVIRRYQ
jgi:parvulin-like peptidyl-prolyl isomerase